MKQVQYAFIDSGIGGVPYLNQLLQYEPNASCVFVADTKNFPYGTKSTEELQQIAIETVTKVIKNFNPEIIVLACNTLSVSSLSILRENFSLPFVGTVPAVKVAIEKTKLKKIVLIATERSIADPYTNALIENFNAKDQVILKPEQELVKKIEEGLLFDNQIEKEKYIKPIIDFCIAHKADCLVLGCTHYLLLKDDFVNLAQNKVLIIESLEGVIKQTLRCSPKKLLSDKTFFYTTSALNETEAEKYKKLCTHFGLYFGGTL